MSRFMRLPTELGGHRCEVMDSSGVGVDEDTMVPALVIPYGYYLRIPFGRLRPEVPDPMAGMAAYMAGKFTTSALSWDEFRDLAIAAFDYLRDHPEFR